MLLYAVDHYHLDKQIGNTVYFFTESEMRSYLKKQNEKGGVIYRGCILDPLLPTDGYGNTNKNGFESFEKFETMVKPEYRFLAMDLYSTIK